MPLECQAQSRIGVGGPHGKELVRCAFVNETCVWGHSMPLDYCELCDGERDGRYVRAVVMRACVSIIEMSARQQPLRRFIPQAFAALVAMGEPGIERLMEAMHDAVWYGLPKELLILEAQNHGL